MTKRKRRDGFPCPACGHKTVVTNSEMTVPEYKKKWLACQNPDCGHVFVASTAFEHTIHPSRIAGNRYSKPKSEAA